MRKTFTKIAGCAALGLLMCFNAPAITKAAVKTVPAKNGVYNAKVSTGCPHWTKLTKIKNRAPFITKGHGVKAGPFGAHHVEGQLCSY